MAGIPLDLTQDMLNIDHEYDNHKIRCWPLHYGHELPELTNGANQQLKMIGVPAPAGPGDPGHPAKPELLRLLNQEFTWSSNICVHRNWWTEQSPNRTKAWQETLLNYKAVFDTPDPDKDLAQEEMSTPILGTRSRSQ